MLEMDIQCSGDASPLTIDVTERNGDSTSEDVRATSSYNRRKRCHARLTIFNMLIYWRDLKRYPLDPSGKLVHNY